MADPSATALPTREGQKDIFEDTDFEVDALDSDADNTIQLEAQSDFDLDESDSASEVFALDEEDVDQNAATAMGPAVLEEDDGLGAAIEEEGASDEMEGVGWGEGEESPGRRWRCRRRGRARSVPPLPPAAGAEPSAGMLTAADGPPWGGPWVGVLGVTTVMMMALAFITMDVVRNLNSFQGDTPVASGLVKMIAGE